MNRAVKRSIFLLAIIALVTPLALGQDADSTGMVPLSKESFLRAAVQFGQIARREGAFLSSVDAEGDSFKNTFAGSLEFGWQPLGGKEWAAITGFPRFGIGLQYLRILHRDELGHPWSFYGFYDGNFLRSKKLQWTNRLAAGLAIGLTTYDPQDEIPNDVISTKVNAFLEFGTGISFALTTRTSLESGVRFSHFSNGNSREPQQGFNVFSFVLGMRSSLAPQPSPPLQQPISECQHRQELLVYLGWGPRQLDFNDQDGGKLPETYGITYLLSNLHLGYNYEVSHQLKVGGGIDLVYDGTNGQRELAEKGLPRKGAVDLQDKLGMMIFVGVESVVDRLSFVANLGYTIMRTRFGSSTPAFEQRIGFKYYFYQNLFAGINVRAYDFKTAKAVEFHLGVRKYL